MQDDFPVPPGFEAIPCPGCGHDGFTQVREGRDWYLDQNRRVRVVRCDACGLHYTNPRPTLEALGAYYPENYPPHLRESQEREERTSGIRSLVLRRAYGSPEQQPRGIARVVAAAVSAIKPARQFATGVPYRGQGRLLDFGCGSGKFLRRMASLGWSVTGLDLGERAVREVQNSGLRALRGTLPHPELSPGSFDVVTMRHSFEHVPDPRTVLAAARDLLTPDGLLLVNVPNYDCWEIDYLGDASLGLQLPRHLLHFTPKTLADLLSRNGFEVLSVRQAGRAGWVRRSLARADRRGRRRADALLRLGPMIALMSRFQQLRGRGNDLTVLAKKA